VFNSIRKRLSLGLILLLIIAGLVMAQTSLWLLDQGLRRYFQSHLHNQAETLIAAFSRQEQNIDLNQERIPATYRRPFSGEYFVVRMQNQQWRSRSLWDFELNIPDQSGLQYALIPGPDEQALLIYKTEFRRFGNRIEVLTAQDYTPVLQEFRRVTWVIVIAGLLVLGLLVFLQGYWVTRAFYPLEKLRKQIAQLQEGERSLLDTQVPDELVPLVKQVNHLLQHTESSLHRSRTALGNLGHALKTPLAVLFSIQSRPELQTYPDITAQLQKQLQQIQERISRELSRARFAGEALPGARFNCDDEIPLLCETLQQIHARDLLIKWQIPQGLKLPWDREDMLELLGNLLDNACKWAKKQVQLSITLTEQGYQILIEDDGPGIAQDAREAMINRGVRMDEQVQGHGLGLGIVKDIVEYAGGELILETSPLQGLRVVVMLPLNAKAFDQN
jgi:signal transduction histidine kinase